MKPYFVKYLPVPGEIKEGDKFIVPDSNVIYERNILGTHDRSHVEKKVKLFLCSRDIQVGGKVVYEAHLDFGVQLVTNIEDDEVVLLNDGSKTHAHNLLKVMGEISPEATWVKEGQEFDEDDWQFAVYDFDERRELPKNPIPKFANLEIKGPCEHFH